MAKKDKYRSDSDAGAKMMQDLLLMGMKGFAESVKKRARRYLRSAKGKTDLEKSFTYELGIDKEQQANPNTRGVQLIFKMNEYGIFVDSGVSGTEVKYRTLYQFTNKQPPAKEVGKWALRKGMRLRDEKSGRFKKTAGQEERIGFLIARKIKKTGIPPTLFFRHALADAMRHDLPGLLGDHYDVWGKKQMEYVLINLAGTWAGRSDRVRSRLA